ncbi:Phosphatidylserine decarboxylase [Lawsonia intracellularis PHE/MN1-00]|nr:Phosphatidylserine decarboxylase [Lawsonia intracellularis PHE/MN1-00]
MKGILMGKTNLGIDQEGFPYIAIFAFSSLIFAILGWWLLAVLCLIGTIFCGHFFRDPERIIPTEANIAVSPADGKIIRIEPRQDPISGESHTCISIFMNICNVHVNRSPIKGQIEAIQYVQGHFLNASLDKAAKENEHCSYLLRDQDGKQWVVVQIAGLIARRIVCRTKEGDILNRGERFGIIRFGSRVDLYLPEEYTPTVNLGNKVIAGETILAKKNQE